MKKGFESLADLASRVEQMDAVKEDYIASSNRMSLHDKKVLDVHGIGTFQLNELAEGQLANKLGIPKQYYDRVGEFPGLRETNVNTLLNADPRKRMVRTMEGTARAFLSDSYKPMDNLPILTGVLQALDGSEHRNNIQVRSSNMTDQKMYLQISFPALRGAVVPGDDVEYGICITNSETGCGSVDVSSMIWRLVCSNGMVTSSVMKKRHVGRRAENSDDYSIYRNDTIMADINAFRLKFRDVMAATITDLAFRQQLNLLREAAGDMVERPETAVKNVTKHYSLADTDSELILSNMVHEGNLNRYGIANGITALAHRIENPDRQFEVERIGHDLITMKTEAFHKIAERVVA